MFIKQSSVYMFNSKIINCLKVLVNKPDPLTEPALQAQVRPLLSTYLYQLTLSACSQPTALVPVIPFTEPFTATASAQIPPSFLITLQGYLPQKNYYACTPEEKLMFSQ